LKNELKAEYLRILEAYNKSYAHPSSSIANSNRHHRLDFHEGYQGFIRALEAVMDDLSESGEGGYTPNSHEDISLSEYGDTDPITLLLEPIIPCLHSMQTAVDITTTLLEVEDIIKINT
jgi:hypothetical protein